ncbi:hypothetical protein CHUAL_010833 [Chamberlinius hualienensis]
MSLCLLLLTLVVIPNFAYADRKSFAHRYKRNPAEEKLFDDAFMYYEMTHTETDCHKPQPRIVSVQSVYPNPSFTYATECVLLHTCAWDTGCCAPSEVCGVKEGHEKILSIPILYFKVDEPDSHDAMLLQFTNHTECTCYNEKERKFDLKKKIITL